MLQFEGISYQYLKKWQFRNQFLKSNYGKIVKTFNILELATVQILKSSKNRVC